MIRDIYALKTRFNSLSLGYSLAFLTEEGTYQIRVKAIGDGVIYTDSEWSSVYTFKIEDEIDAAPVDASSYDSGDGTEERHQRLVTQQEHRVMLVS